MLKKSFLTGLVILAFTNLHGTDIDNARRRYAGLFKITDQKLEGIKFGNWGSRPFEYAWASSLFSLVGKNVIDLGVGLPTQYTWYAYVLSNLKPNFYAGIDFDARIQNEVQNHQNYEIRYMNMADLKYPDNSFDIAFCISTFEHIPYESFIKSIQEAHRVLKDDGLLVLTLDEAWDMSQSLNHDNGWNVLEQSLIELNIFSRKTRSFGLPEFLELIKDYFVLYQDDAVVDRETQSIRSADDNYIYYSRANRDASILNSGSGINSCVSYALLKKQPKKEFVLSLL